MEKAPSTQMGRAKITDPMTLRSHTPHKGGEKIDPVPTQSEKKKRMGIGLVELHTWREVSPSKPERCSAENRRSFQGRHFQNWRIRNESPEGKKMRKLEGGGCSAGRHLREGHHSVAGSDRNEGHRCGKVKKTK